MASFHAAYPEVRANEGGYANHAKDRGGETYKGVARKIWPAWSGWPIIDSYRNLPGFPANLEKDAKLQELVLLFFKQNFWDKMNLDRVNDQAIAVELFDTGVNCGVGVASLFLQRVLNVLNRNGKDYADLPLTGYIGPLTLSNLNNHSRPKTVLKMLNCLQGEKYISIAENNPDQEVFMNGWMARVTI